MDGVGKKKKIIATSKPYAAVCCRMLTYADVCWRKQIIATSKPLFRFYRDLLQVSRYTSSLRPHTLVA